MLIKFIYMLDIYSYVKEEKYRLLINKRESTSLQYLNDSKAFIECLNDMDDIYKNVEQCNPNKKRKISIVFDDSIADMLNNNITQFYFAVTKYIRLNLTHYFVMKIRDKKELQQIALNYSSDIDFQDFMILILY